MAKKKYRNLGSLEMDLDENTVQELCQLTGHPDVMIECEPYSAWVLAALARGFIAAGDPAADLTLRQFVRIAESKIDFYED